VADVELVIVYVKIHQQRLNIASARYAIHATSITFGFVVVHQVVQIVDDVVVVLLLDLFSEQCWCLQIT
jgi:hypothetical protein